MTSVSWATVLMVTMHAIFFHVMPRISRPDILFSVTVPEAFAAGAGRTLISRYRAIVWTAAAISIALSLLLSVFQPDSMQGALLMTVTVAGNAIVAMSAWVSAQRKARAHAIPPSEVRVASLVPRDTSLPGGTLFAAGPFAILLAAALLRYTYLDDVPDGPDAANPFGQLAFGAIFVAMMLMMAVTLARRSRQVAVDGPAAAAEQRFRRVNVLIPVLVGYVAAISMSIATVESIPAFGDTIRWSGGFMLLPIMFMVFGFGVNYWMFRVGQGGSRTVAPAARREVHGDATPDAAWKVGGLYYVNPHDPAIWVENRVGLGYTLNFGNWRAWLLIIGMMLIPMVASRFLFWEG
jgi:uncharacterized membrane protein